VPPLPAGHGLAEQQTFGILTNIPLVWLALAVPLAWRERSAEGRSVLGGFLAAVALLFWIGALTLGLFFYAAGRYEVEFLPALVLLAVTGILSLERAVAGQPVRRRAMRWGWSLLLGFSVAFNLLASVKRGAEWHWDMGTMLVQQGKVQEAIEQYEQALRLKPDFAEVHDDLASALVQTGKIKDAIAHFEQALQIKPDSIEAHNNLGIALMGQGRLREAMEQYEQALRIEPDFAEAHYNLGLALMGQGRPQEAIGHYEQAVRIKPDSAEAHNNLGNALLQAGKVQEAIQQYEQALRIKPDLVQAQINLARARAAQ
jgi:tetratricopeptide (TPR) repeat protein